MRDPSAIESIFRNEGISKHLGILLDRLEQPQIVQVGLQVGEMGRCSYNLIHIKGTYNPNYNYP